MDLPKMTRRSLALARVACLALGALLALALSATTVGGSIESGFYSLAGEASRSSALDFLLWAAVALLLYQLCFAVLRRVWSGMDSEPSHEPLIRKSDLTVMPGTRMSHLPRFRERLEKVCRTGDAVDFVNELVSAGFSLGASDLHVSPSHDSYSITMRVHGMLFDLVELPPGMYPNVVRRVKVLSDLPTFRRDVPQDGHMRFEDRTYTARVSVFPTNHGDRIAVRLVSSRASVLDLARIGMPEEMLETYKALLNASQGMIIVTGPTGSGKSTTMFASLLYVQRDRGDSVNIVTLEDPIETDFRHFHQTQVSREGGMTFSTGLRALLRQDPDVIMLGEIRDDETAGIAMRAAMTGHLILTTVHASTTTGVFGRLSQMGIGDVQLSSGIHAVISQRLCHRLCEECRVPAGVDDQLERQLRLAGIEEPPEGEIYESAGCEHCLGKGFTGRVALFEMLTLTDDIRDMVAEGLPGHRILRAARQSGMRTLYDHGLELARAGKVSLMEVARLVSG